MSIDNKYPLSADSDTSISLFSASHSPLSCIGRAPDTRNFYSRGKSPKSEAVRTYIAAENSTEARRLAAHLNAHDDISVIGYAVSASELDAALHLRRDDLDVLITDIKLDHADITEIIAKATLENPHLNVLCYTYASDEASVIRAIQAGAMGYILRGSSEDLPNCVRLLHGGGSPVSPIVARSVLRALHAQSRESQHHPRTDNQPLSNRETEILQLLSKGISFAEIGLVLSISPHTVTAHIKKIYKKLQVHSRGEAVYEAQCLGLLPKH